MDRPCSKNAKHGEYKGCSLLDAGRQEKERKTKRNMAENSGKRNEGKGLVMEVLGNSSQGQDTVEVIGWGLMFRKGRRGLSK